MLLNGNDNGLTLTSVTINCTIDNHYFRVPIGVLLVVDGDDDGLTLTSVNIGHCRLERCIITNTLLDQWLATIENHRYQWTEKNH